MPFEGLVKFSSSQNTVVLFVETEWAVGLKLGVSDVFQNNCNEQYGGILWFIMYFFSLFENWSPFA